MRCTFKRYLALALEWYWLALIISLVYHSKLCLISDFYINYNGNMQSYKFRLQPNKEQREKLDNMFGCSRFTWNYFLDFNNKIYLEAKEKDLKKKHLNYYDCANKLTELKTKNKWLKEANSQSLQQTLKDLDTAYSRFFQKKGGFPKFKSKKGSQSFRVPQFFKLKGNNSCFPKFRKGIKTIIHRKVLGNVKYATISKTKTDKYFVSSKACSCCGFVNQDLTLADRNWQCPRCKTELDRDINASQNILAQVLRELNTGGGRGYRLKPAELSSIDEAVKQEAFGSLVQR
jgi:transposase